MAIPHWSWEAAGAGGETPSPQAPTRQSPDRERLAEASEAFGALSNPIRLEIIAALVARSGPVTYTDLRSATSVEDNGRFNYHVRRLGDLVVRRDGGYELTDRGEAAAELLDVRDL